MNDLEAIRSDNARRLALKWGGWWGVVRHPDDTLGVIGGRSVWLRLERLPVVASWWSHEAGAVCDGACRIGVDGPAWNDEYLPDCANSRLALRTMPDGWARSLLHY